MSAGGDGWSEGGSLGSFESGLPIAATHNQWHTENATGNTQLRVGKKTSMKLIGAMVIWWQNGETKRVA